MLSDAAEGVGQTVDGTLRQYGVFHESTIVHMPSNLSFVEAATLTCSGLTAWNALFGLESKAPRKGDVVVVQGTGGVSIAALQVCLLAAAAILMRTHSRLQRTVRRRGRCHRHSHNKLRCQGETTERTGCPPHTQLPHHPRVGAKTKELTPDGKGAHLIVDVGGASTVAQSLIAVRPDGVVACAGVLGDAPDGKIPTVLDGLWAGCIVRAVIIGTRKMFREMNAFVEAKGVRPVVDERVFGFEEVPEAYRYMSEAKHFSKIGIELW